MLIEFVGHTAGEWALMLNGSARIQAINSDGQTFIDDVSKGDVWVCNLHAHAHLRSQRWPLELG